LEYHQTVNRSHIIELYRRDCLAAIARYLCRRTRFCVLLLACPLAVGQDQAAKLSPAAAEQFQRATDAMRTGDLTQAADAFDAVVKNAPQFAEAYLNLGLVREEQKRHADAVTNFKKALSLKPRLRGANLFLGIAEFRSNQLEPAILALQKETAISPKDANAWMWLGVAQLEKGDGRAAASALDRAADLAPDNVDILYHRGRAHLLVSNQSYAKMFEADPKSWRIRQLLAEADASAERHQDAIAEYELAIKQAPNEPRLHEELGTQYRLANKLPEAEQAYLRELEIDPDNVTAQYKLGVLALETGDAARGKNLIEGALRVRPDLQHADYNLGRAEMLLGEDSEALKHFERAVSSATAAASDPSVVEQSWYQLGIVYRRLGRMADAQNAMATFKKLKDDDAETSAKALKRFQVQQGAPSAQPDATPQNQ
jgi:tetratricopeptide (TPR) repeat protein